MRLLVRYRLLIVVCAAALGFGAWEAWRLSEPLPPFKEAMALPREAETIAALFPGGVESHYYASEKALFLRFDRREAREHLERALASGVKTDETMLHSYAALLVQMQADPREIDAAVAKWRWNYPRSTLKDPRQLQRDASFPAWMQAGALRPVALARARPLYAAVNEEIGTLELTNLVSGAERRLPQEGDHAMRYLFEFSNSGAILAGVGDDSRVQLWDVEGATPKSTLSGHTSQVQCLAFTADDRFCASGSVDQTVRLWNVAAGKLLTTFSGHNRPVSSVAFSPDGKLLASGDWSGEVRIWDVQQGRPLRSLRVHEAAVASLAFAPDGKTLATGARDSLVKLFRVDSGTKLHTFRGHEAPVYCVTFSRSGKTVASCSGDRTVRLWTVATGQQRAMKDGYPDSIFAVNIASDGRSIMAACFDNSIHFWRPETATPPVK